MPVLKLLLYMSTEIFLWMGFKVKKAVVSCHKCQVFRNNYLPIKKPIKENADPMLKLNVLVKNSFLTNSRVLVSNMTTVFRNCSRSYSALFYNFTKRDSDTSASV